MLHYFHNLTFATFATFATLTFSIHLHISKKSSTFAAQAERPSYDCPTADAVRPSYDCQTALRAERPSYDCQTADAERPIKDPLYLPQNSPQNQRFSGAPKRGRINDPLNLHSVAWIKKNETT